MKKLFASVVLSLALVACGQKLDPKYASPSGELQDKASVMLLVLCEDGSLSGGSGFAVSKNQLITAKHVIACGEDNSESPKVITVKTYDGNSYFATVDKVPCDDTDAARLIILGDKNPFKQWFQVSMKEPKIDEEVHMRGGMSRYPKNGKILNLGDSDYYYLGMEILHGDSGSPLLNQDGKVIGIVVMLGYSINRQPFGIANKSSDWKDLLPGGPGECPEEPEDFTVLLGF